MNAMNVIDACEILARHNEWRRGADTEMANPVQLGVAIEVVSEAAVRYEAVRRLNPLQFQELYQRNLLEGVPFDSLVDELVRKGN